MKVVSGYIYRNKTVITGREKKKKLLFMSSLKGTMERKDEKKSEGKEHTE